MKLRTTSLTRECVCMRGKSYMEMLQEREGGGEGGWWVGQRGKREGGHKEESAQRATGATPTQTTVRFVHSLSTSLSGTVVFTLITLLTLLMCSELPELCRVVGSPLSVVLLRGRRKKLLYMRL